MAIKCYCDGSFRNDKGGIGVVAFREKTKLFTIGRRVKVKNNNEAEFLAIMAGLKALKSKKNEEILVISDSKTVMRELTEHKESHVKKFNEYAVKILKEAKKFKNLKFKWEGRENTSSADEIAKGLTKKEE